MDNLINFYFTYFSSPKSVPYQNPNLDNKAQGESLKQNTYKLRPA